ncbi:hypothetical protein BDV18DRAFT_133588 [Aspergillus unguis]
MFRWLLSRLFVGLLPLAITSTVYLYLYPVFSGCAYPLPTTNASQQPNAFLQTLKQHLLPQSDPFPSSENAIFRLLVLADPQLEGDTSLPRRQYELSYRLQKHYNDTLDSLSSASFPYILDPDVRNTISAAFRSVVSEDIPRAFAGARKRLDLLGNDYYLAHIYRTLHWWARPTHVTVLGDLIGSQWVSDEEFARRGQRYWERVFEAGERADDLITRSGQEGYGDGNEQGEVEVVEELPSSSSWANRIINIVGNHDIGYSGDASEHRIKRFEDVFGRANWDIRFQHPTVKVKAGVEGEEKVLNPTLHLINLNTLTLDGPAYSQDIQNHGYTYINDLISHRSYPVEDRSTFTLLLTHLPLHKPEGVCTDGPYFTYFDKDDDSDKQRYKSGGLREQNHLSEHVSVNGVLQGIFGMNGHGSKGRNGLILTGHDHEGCDVIHSLHKSTPAENNDNSEPDTPSESEDQDPWSWNATRYTHMTPPDPTTASIREITLRSMMGEYGGNAGLLSIWFDTAAAEWKYAVQMCPAGVQHIWWAVHVVDLITVIVGVLFGSACIFGSSKKSSLHVKGDKKTR